MKYIIAIAFLLAAPILLMAETVMISVGSKGLPPEPGAGYKFCFSAVESGLMDAFFDAGHIVFNDDNFRSTDDFYRTVRLARDGGANSVLFVDCVYEAGAEKTRKTQDGIEVSLPRKIVMSYVRASDSMVIRKAEMQVSGSEAEKFPFIEDYYALLGRRAAKSIL